MIKTAVVILNWNGKEFLEMFLGKVIENSGGPDTEVYVADNGSDDGSCDYLETFRGKVKVLRLDENHGFAGGYNLALSRIEARYYVLLNSDIEVTEGWLEPLTGALDSDPNLASCQPKILSWKDRDRFEYAGAAGGFIDRYGYPFCRGRIFTHTEADKGQYDTPASLFWSSGACMAVRAEAWHKAGGFDADFFAHMEEIDLCWRFHRLGYSISFVPRSVVYHVGGASLPYNSPFKTFLNFRNSLYLLYKNLPDENFARTIFFRKLLDGVAALFFLLKGQTSGARAVWKAHQEVKKQKNVLKEKRRKVKSMGEYKFSELVLNKSIVFEFYIMKRKKYSSL
ncbi:MAG: glycosyltransferase family 2 protein [Bacteroidales bacterium]|nr:glycosyltransferase family 2 protein [Bacteroidales bacterium]MBN2632898.1 glycosyltransferase family 2 protein [Bacteroidales bacterium]